ncbi:nitrate respiration regulation accessory nitrate sensor NreA [Mammaliicoccus sciuri]|uniref:nitrate respiration regulation accessory nitrate sensor NreA n=1 Tax=Mammaliicoccus sciuri TaxID=1296 RepID=UPI0013E945B9|nr:nitrate respiration regulation accessory nitrate sensor NreA [Mammaliicoccus sciuri]MCD3219164.1 nitrate respiration regulation accessory nitrate sensor NreA [Mammaliicoccus sciuri]MCJ0909348.1 nitrate respiration regulation accessory nitrate sensor NreA [Mammaliicoccus sciuri]MCJ0923232.1 nitrate respiration regulation accessory nitrate sensor NreA [Mammaliicoccus sciuri]MCJ0925574.1 nitrate respiration regulation accessory nitrate sensor NreA [Mammaliicoccus sciuri]MCJ1762614.1 nitrate re
MSNDFDFQEQLDLIRSTYGVDFVGLAMTSENSAHFHIKWQYVSGNLNHRYQNIVLRSGRGIAGIVIKSGKPIEIRDLKESPYHDQLFNYPIVQSEQLTSLLAIPLWKKYRVYGVLLLGQRDDKLFPEIDMNDFNRFGPFYGKDMMNA